MVNVGTVNIHTWMVWDLNQAFIFGIQSLISRGVLGCPYTPVIYGCFLKWWYPQIINFNRVFHYKPSILGYPYFWKPPYVNYIKISHHHSCLRPGPARPCRTCSWIRSLEGSGKHSAERSELWGSPINLALFVNMRLHWAYLFCRKFLGVKNLGPWYSWLVFLGAIL